MESLRIICPNGHLGFAPTREESFHIGVAARPDCIAADSGSDDVGPIPSRTVPNPDTRPCLGAHRYEGCPIRSHADAEVGVQIVSKP